MTSITGKLCVLDAGKEFYVTSDSKVDQSVSNAPISILNVLLVCELYASLSIRTSISLRVSACVIHLLLPA